MQVNDLLYELYKNFSMTIIVYLIFIYSVCVFLKKILHDCGLIGHKPEPRPEPEHDPYDKFRDWPRPQDQPW